jgi:hypothetical protein
MSAVWGGAGMVLLAVGCRSDPPAPLPVETSVATATATGSAGVSPPMPAGVVGVPVPSESVAKVMNPKGEAPYSGPTGTLKGRVRIKGDPPPETGITVPVGKCGEAAATWGRLFRVGQDGALADALVTVVGYSGFVPEKEEAEKVTLHGCALNRRTVAAAFGQRIEVANIDPIESHMPYLDGAPVRAVMVAIPRGDPVRLYPAEPGHYLIRDQIKPFVSADVFVLKYSTHDVTDLDGEYEVAGIPVGKVLAVAYLPVLHDEVKKEIEIKPGDNALDFELTFDLEKWKAKKAKRQGEPQPSAAAPEKGPKG